MQSPSEKRREAYLHRLKQSGQAKAYDLPSQKMVEIPNPHLIEGDDGSFRIEGEYRGHMVSRYVSPPK